MGDKIVQVPGVGNVSFPGSMSDDDIAAAIKGNNASPDVSTSQGRASVLSQQGLSATDPSTFRPPAPQGLQQQSAGPDLSGILFGKYGHAFGRGLGQTVESSGDVLAALPEQVRNLISAAKSGSPPVQSSGQSIAHGFQQAMPVTVAPQRPGQNLGERFAESAGASAPQLIMAAEGVRGAMSDIPPSPMGADEAAAKLTDAINPAPRSMARVQQNIADHLPQIADAANGTQIADRAGLSRVLKAVADQKRADYYQNILEPVGDKTISVAGSNYNGAMQDPTSRVATLRQLDARLSQINATMRPQYEKGGATAQAAISAEGMQSLKTEAASIRAKLYKEIANATGMAPEDVAKARETFGALGDLADKTQLSISKDRFAQNAAKQGRSVIIDGVPTKAGLADRAFNFAQRKTLGNPADNAIADVFKRLKLTPPPPMGKP